MKITIIELINIWNGLDKVYGANDILPGGFDYHMKRRNVPILQVEIRKLEPLDEDTLKDISGDEIEIPLSKIKPSMLPDKMPKGTLDMISPLIIEDEQKEHQSQVAKLLEGQKNGKQEKVKDNG